MTKIKIIINTFLFSFCLLLNINLQGEIKYFYDYSYDAGGNNNLYDIAVYTTISAFGIYLCGDNTTASYNYHVVKLDLNGTADWSYDLYNSTDGAAATGIDLYPNSATKIWVTGMVKSGTTWSERTVLLNKDGSQDWAKSDGGTFTGNPDHYPVRTGSDRNKFSLSNCIAGRYNNDYKYMFYDLSGNATST
ncbi:MAG TPA: hypothetical protein VKS21_01725, partial [Spirochaetota bacterium]|nr:hypothetical protein [Spirochaetota bacterium]